MNLVGRSFARDTFLQAFSGEAVVRAMLDFEAALAAAEAEAGVFPQEAAHVIGKACSELSLSPETLAVEGKRSGSLAVPLVKALSEHVARADLRAAAFVHYGSTSQDVLDTAMVLCLKPCLVDADRVLATVGEPPGRSRSAPCRRRDARPDAQCNPPRRSRPASRSPAGRRRSIGAGFASARHASEPCACSSAGLSAPWTPSATSARRYAGAWPRACVWVRHVRGTITETSCCA